MTKIHLKKLDFASIRLTAIYVTIIMFISISFSVFFYNFASMELNRGLGKQLKAYNSMGAQSLIDKLETIRLEQLAESNEHLRLNLIYYNLLILIISSAGGYFLARKSLQPIEDVMDEQSRFTADASHELRTPLTAMKTEIEVALRAKDFDFDNAKTVLASNLEEIGKLEVLSNALLKLARAENTKLEFKSVKLENVLQESLKKIDKLAKIKEIGIETNTANYSVLGEKDSLVELLVILLDNAIKYSPKKTTISIIITKELSKTTVKITDQGQGIKASDLPYIFNRFYRADSSRNKEKVEGYGLGLSIAKQIADMHDAQIGVKSKIGEGSQFILVFN